MYRARSPCTWSGTPPSGEPDPDAEPPSELPLETADRGHAFLECTERALRPRDRLLRVRRLLGATHDVPAFISYATTDGADIAATVSGFLGAAKRIGATR